ncbi:MAG TPA: THUMP domain-containing protein [Candidatus Binatus sp.]|nr:THUMP domain-containing protein [Candidatus Binatus sp.]
MLKDFNLLISSARGNERDAGSELRYLLRELGDSTVITGQTPVSGLIIAKTVLDPVQAIDKLRPVLSKNPWQFRYVLKIKPIMRVVSADIGEICRAVGSLANEVKAGETFRVSVQRRHSVLDSKQVIEQAAKQVPRGVDLQNPSRIVLIEIIGDVAGVSIISKSDILAVESEKRRNPILGLKGARSVPIPAA